MPLEYVNKFVANVAGGYNDSAVAEYIADGESPYLNNIRFDRNRAIVDTGYYRFGQAALLGTPQLTYKFVRQSGVIELLLVTTETVYKWNSSSEEWDLLYSGATTLTGAHAAGSYNLTVANSAVFTAGEWMGVALTSGYQHKAMVLSVPDATHVRIRECLPSVAGNGNAVGGAVTLTGSLDDIPTMDTLPFADCCYLANGQNHIQEYDGTTMEDAQNLPSAGDTTAKIVRVFENYLILFNTTEGGTRHPHRVRRCDTGDPTNWTTGNAGLEDLLDREEEIKAAEILGPYLIIYREESISRLEYVGSDDQLFNIELMVVDGGALSTASVIGHGIVHRVVGPTSIYTYAGDFEINKTFGDKIWRKVFGPGGELNRANRERAYAHYCEALNEYWFMVPSGSADYPDLLLRFNDTYKAWSWRRFHHKTYGAGKHETPNVVRWIDLVGTWAEQNWTWNSMFMETQAPLVLLFGGTPNQCWQYDYVAGSDPFVWEDWAPTVWESITENWETLRTQSIDYEYQTKEFADPHYLARFNMADVLIKGTGINPYITTDRGSSWKAFTMLGPGGSYVESRLWKQTISRSFRLKFSGSGGGFALQWINLQYKQEAEW